MMNISLFGDRSKRTLNSHRKSEKPEDVWRRGLLYDDRSKKGVNYLRKHFSAIRSDDDFREIVQEANTIFYEKIVQPGFILMSSLDTFFIGICEIVAIHHLSSSKSHLMLNIDDFIPPLEDELRRKETKRSDKLKRFWHPLDGENNPNPEEDLLRKEKIEIVQGIFRIMPSHCKDKLMMFYGKGFSWNEIAEMVQESPTSIRMSAKRCKDQFVKKYNEEKNK